MAAPKSNSHLNPNQIEDLLNNDDDELSDLSADDIDDDDQKPLGTILQRVHFCRSTDINVFSFALDVYHRFQ
jgi:hypothetical protein